jgi:hypothetical protein
LPTTPSVRRTVACIVCSSLFVQAEISNEFSAALGQKEQLRGVLRPRRLQRSTGRSCSIPNLCELSQFGPTIDQGSRRVAAASAEYSGSACVRTPYRCQAPPRTEDGFTERRRSRTDRAWGYHTAQVSSLGDAGRPMPDERWSCGVLRWPRHNVCHSPRSTCLSGEDARAARDPLLRTRAKLDAHT